MSGIIFLNHAAVTGYHKEQIAQHGGSDGIRDMGLLESALGKAQNIYAYNPDCTIFDLAASYGFGIAKNHPFLDGNKRTALVSTISFLRRNGYKLNAPLEDVYKTFYLLAAGEVSEKSLSKWLEINSMEIIS